MMSVLAALKLDPSEGALSACLGLGHILLRKRKFYRSNQARVCRLNCKGCFEVLELVDWVSPHNSKTVGQVRPTRTDFHSKYLVLALTPLPPPTAQRRLNIAFTPAMLQHQLLKVRLEH